MVVCVCVVVIVLVCFIVVFLCFCVLCDVEDDEFWEFDCWWVCL